MKIIVHSYSINERKKRYIKSKVEKYIKLLRFSKIMDGHTLTVKVLKKGYLLDSNTEDAIYILPLARRKNSPLNKEHTIIINNKIVSSREKLLRALIHELIHLRQYVKRKLIYLRPKTSFETFAVWSKKSLGAVDSISYWKQPWEVEAMRLEEKYWKEKKL